MSGFDVELVFERFAALFVPDYIGVDVQAFPASAPPFPVLGLFAGSDFINYDDTLDGFGSMNVDLRTAFTYGAEDSLRALYRLLSKGTSRPTSLYEVIASDRTLDGLVHDIQPLVVSVDVFGDENAGLYVGTIRCRILMGLD